MLIAILQGGTIFNFHVLFGVLYLSSWYEVLFTESSLSIRHLYFTLQPSPSRNSPLRCQPPRPLALEDEGGPGQRSHSVPHGRW